jgi:MYXO-CTERM domain-containing protein
MAAQTGAGSSFTNHPGVIDYKGKSYLFYHNGALPGGGGYKRSVCVEEFTYGADGKIPRINMSTEGPDPVATLNPFQQVEAETIAFSAGLKTEKCMDTGGGMNVTSISNGDYIKVRNVDFLDGVTSFDARVSSAGSNAKIEVRLDSQTGMLLGECDVAGTSAWTTKTCEVSGGSGVHDLFLKFTGGSGELFKFNWWKFDGPNTGGTGGAGGMGGMAGVGGTGGSSGAASGSSGGPASGSGGTGGSSPGGSGGSAMAGMAGQLVAGTGGALGGNGGANPTAGAGGKAGASGAPAQGGGGATAGTGAAVAGRAGASAGSPSSEDPESDEGGCGCRVGSGKSSHAAALSALLLLGLALRRRRRVT